MPRRILVIEDERDTRENIRDILALDGYEVVEAESVAQALDRTDWSRLFAITLDWRLPDGDADLLLPRLRQLAPDVPVVVSTGKTELSGAIAALRHGAADYILKPVDADILRASLRRLVERRRLTDDKKRAEAALHESRERLQAIVNAAVDAIITIDERGRVESFNPAAQRMFGYTADEMIGRNVNMLMPLPYREQHDGYLAAYLATGEKRLIGSRREIVGRRKDATTFPIDLSVSETLLAGGRRLFTGIVRDITERKQSQRRMLQSERLAAIGQMVTGLAHESRNALQRSQACLEMLTMEVEARPETLNLVQRLQAAQDHLHQLFDEVRSYAAPITLNREPCDLAHLWRDVWSDLSLTMGEKKVHLIERLGDVDLACRCDPFAMGQVLRNVLENAVAACPDSGRIVIRATEASLNRQPAVCLSIQDNGPGFSPEARLHVFEPFFTTKTKGTGLGMAIAYRVVEAHRGQIAVDGNPDGGAEIFITLPRNEA